MRKIIYILICIPFLVACKKDDSTPENNKRIKQITISNNAIKGAIKIYYNYDNDLLVSRIVTTKSNSSYNTWDTTLKCNYSYSGNIVTAIAYSGEDGELNLAEKAEYEFTDDRMDRMKYYEYVDGQFINRHEYIFNFNGDLLESFNLYYDVNNNGILVECSKGEYTYQDQNVTRFRIKDIYYDQYYYNENFAYENGHLDNMISSEDERLTNTWKNVNKEKYDYNDDNTLKTIKIHDWHFYWAYIYSITMEYDQGYLISENYSDYTYGLLNEYTYEDGIGNSEQLLYTPIDKIYNYPIIRNRNDISLKTNYKFEDKLMK